MACDPNTLLADAKCWIPLSRGHLMAALIQQLYVSWGGTATPAQLLASSTCWNDPVSSGDRWAVFVKLLCTWNGDPTCDQNTVLADAKCWLQQSSGLFLPALVQAICDDNGGCVIADVLEDSKCYMPFSWGQSESVMVWLMCQIVNEEECDPQTLIDSAACWSDLSIGELQASAIALACSGELVHGDFNNDFNDDFDNQ